MNALIVGDNQAVASSLREGLVRRGLQCPESHVVPYGAAVEKLQTIQPPPGLILVLLGSEVERGESVIQALRACEQSRIVAIGARDPNRILGAFHAGATDYLDERCQIIDEVMASLDRAAALAEHRAALNPLLSVVSASGGCGRTTLATNLAALAASAQGRCALLDLDLHGGNAAAFLNIKSRHTVADLCRNFDKLDRNMLEQSLLRHESGIHLLPATEMREDLADVSVQGLVRILQLARTLYPYVVVDLNDRCEGHRQILRQSTHVLLVSRLDFAALVNAHKAIEYFDLVGVERDRIHLVFNRCGQPGELPLARVEQALGLMRCDHLPDDPKAVNLSINCGQACVLESPKSRFSIALRGIAEKLGVIPGTESHQGAPRESHVPAPAGERVSAKSHGFFGRLGLNLG